MKCLIGESMWIKIYEEKIGNGKRRNRKEGIGGEWGRVW